MKYIDKYLDVKKMLKDFVNKQYFYVYGSNDLFYLLDNNNRAIAAFSDNIFNESFGLQFFFNDAGLNYVHDVFTSETGFSVNHFFSETIILAFVKKNNLTDREKEYLKKHNIKVVKEYNFIPYTFKEGYGINFLSGKEFDRINEYLIYLKSILKNEETDIITAFQCEKMVVAFFDQENMSYYIKYEEAKGFETFPNLKAVNKPFVEEYKLSSYVDDTCYIAHCYFPYKENLDDHFPSIFMAYYKNQGFSHHIIVDCKPKNINDYIYGFLDEVFSKYGIPTDIVINNRKILANTLRTLKKLDINVSFERENSIVDDELYGIIDSKLEDLKYQVQEEELVS